MQQHPQPAAAADAGGGVNNNPPPIPAPGNRSLPHRRQQQQQQQSSPALLATIARSLTLGIAKCEMRVHVTLLTLGRTRAEECPSLPVNARHQRVGWGGVENETPVVGGENCRSLKLGEWVSASIIVNFKGDNLTLFFLYWEDMSLKRLDCLIKIW